MSKKIWKKSDKRFREIGPKTAFFGHFLYSAYRPTWPNIRPNNIGRNWPNIRPNIRYRSYTMLNRVSKCATLKVQSMPLRMSKRPFLTFSFHEKLISRKMSEVKNFQKCPQRSTEKRKIHSHSNNISWKHLKLWFIIKKVNFTEFLLKNLDESKSP